MRVRERNENQALVKTRTSVWIFKRDRLWQTAAVLLVAGLVLLSVSEYAIQPYKENMTYSTSMFSRNSGSVLQDNNQTELFIQALAPNYPIVITIEDPAHYELDYSVLFINDTNQAVGVGPRTVLFQGQVSNTTTLTINNAIYNMTYELVLTPHNSQTSYTATVLVKQTEYLYPPVNYLLFIPAVISLIAALVITGVKMSTGTKDRDKYYIKLGSGKDYGAFQSRSAYHPSYSYHRPNRQARLLNIPIGISLMTVGVFSLGKFYLLTWLGITLIFVGVAFSLNGVVNILLRGKFDV